MEFDLDLSALVYITIAVILLITLFGNGCSGGSCS